MLGERNGESSGLGNVDEELKNKGESSDIVEHVANRVKVRCWFGNGNGNGTDT
jgi:hypothetical protein